jgi:hypothetical protein
LKRSRAFLAPAPILSSRRFDLRKPSRDHFGDCQIDLFTCERAFGNKFIGQGYENIAIFSLRRASRTCARKSG